MLGVIVDGHLDQTSVRNPQLRHVIQMQLHGNKRCPKSVETVLLLESLGPQDWVKTLVPTPSHSWDLWIFIPLKHGIFIGIDPYPYRPPAPEFFLIRIPGIPGKSQGIHQGSPTPVGLSTWSARTGDRPDNGLHKLYTCFGNSYRVDSNCDLRKNLDHDSVVNTHHIYMYIYI